MDIERLEELKDMFENARTFNDVHWLSPVTKDDVLELIDDAIARQPVTSEEVQRAIEELSQASDGSHYAQDGAHVKTPISLATIDLAITALQAYQPWVSVEDGLPDGDLTSVLIYTKEGGVAEGQCYPTIRAWKQFRWSVEDSKVIHWKPLPEPPKGD